MTEAFTAALGPEAVITAPRLMGSEDFSDIARAVNAPYCFWLFGGTDAEVFGKAAADGTIASSIPVNHSPHYAPVIQPTLDTGTATLVSAAMAWLAG